MHPPDSTRSYRPPAYGQADPGAYPPQYPGSYVARDQPQYPARYPMQYPGPYAPPYQYVQYAPPPGKSSSRTVQVVVAVVVALAVLIPVILAGAMVVYLQTIPRSGGEVETSLGLRVSGGRDGTWLIDVTSGTRPARSVTLQVLNPVTGQTTLSKLVSTLAPYYKDPDATWNDNSQNNRLDAGDTIQLRSSGGQVAAGYRVQLLSGENVIGTIKELPA